ncbi:threonine synthase [Lentilactobacillus kosonis]|uniref:Threonine synthase n=1 Tax=Lentilactobacillus kosonis TaxID=2810561 RepID=A0A401FJG6_9LACO|nr:threonine synthase [Lentilactobacillus kosonis]
MGDHVNFTVPTGNFGDVLAGYYAKLMGLPVNKFIVAANQNNVLADFFESGIYDRNRPFFKTVAPSMDIQISSNFERLLYYKTNGNTKYVSHLMNQLETSGKYQVTPELLAAIKQDFYFGYSSDDDIRSSIHDTYHDYHYLMDPHTAAGYKVMRDYQQIDDQTPMILLSTASPYKFIDVVNQALNLSSASDQQTIMTDINRVTGIKIPNNLINVWNLPVRFTDIIQKNDMQDYVLNKVKEDFQ